MKKVVNLTVSDGSAWSVPKDWSSSTIEITVGPIDGMEHLCGGGGGTTEIQEGGDYATVNSIIIDY